MLAPLRRMPSFSTARIALCNASACFCVTLLDAAQRMQLRNVQTFVGINIAKPGKKGLVEEQWL